MTENPQSSDSYAVPDGNMRPARESMHQIHRAIDARACNAMAEMGKSQKTEQIVR